MKTQSSQNLPFDAVIEGIYIYKLNERLHFVSDVIFGKEFLLKS